MRILGVLFAIACGYSALSFGQTTDAQESVDRQFIEHVLGSLRQHAPPALRAGMQQVEYVYVRSNDPWIMRAAQVGGEPKIEFSTGAFGLIASLAVGRANSVFAKDGAQKYSRWITHVASQLKEGRYAYPQYLDFTGEPQTKNKYYEAVLRNSVLTTLTYVLAHESAHILLDHTKELGGSISRQRAQEMELAADLLTVDLISGLGGRSSQSYVFYATGYKELFLLSAAMNMDILGFAGMREHPPEFLRAARMAAKYKSRARVLGFKDSKDLAFINQQLDREAAYYRRYKLTVEYQTYVNTPGNPVISFAEWRKKFGK